MNKLILFKIYFAILFSVQMRAQTVHLISALGADSTIYSNIELDASFKVNHVVWIKPFKRETLRNYCSRIIRLNQIEEDDIIIGTSFGGIVATEIGKLTGAEKVILISSISMGSEKPPKFKFLKVFRFNKLIPKPMLNNPKIIIKSCFGKVSEEEEAFLSEMILDYDVDLVYWSLNQIMKYENDVSPAYLIKINGSGDKTFPSKYINTDYEIEGTHLMVYNKAKKISNMLNTLIKEDCKDTEFSRQNKLTFSDSLNPNNTRNK